MTNICFSSCHKTKERNKFFYEFSAIDSIEEVIEFGVIQVNSPFTRTQAVNIYIANGEEVVGREGGKVDRRMETIKVNDNSLWDQQVRRNRSQLPFAPFLPRSILDDIPYQASLLEFVLL